MNRCPAHYGAFPCVLAVGHKGLHKMKGGATFRTTPEAPQPAEAAVGAESGEDSEEAPEARSRP